METNAIAQPLTTNQAPPPAKDGTVLSSDFETFLKMLTAQAKYQDPLDPIDSSQYASQLAQFSAVEQQVLGNDLLTEIASQLGASNLAQMAGWIGMEARTTAPVSFSGIPVTLFPQPDATADQAYLVVSDNSGTEVQRLEIPLSGGPVEWAGVSDQGAPFPSGSYSFLLENLVGGEPVSTKLVESYMQITEARQTGGNTVLVLEGGALVVPQEITALRQD